MATAVQEQEVTKEKQEEEVVEEDDEHGCKERVLHKYFLLEWKLVKSLLHDIVSDGGVSDPSYVHKIRSIMDKYQEQGQLLEPYLESIVSPLMSIVRSKLLHFGANSDEVLEVVKPLCIIIYAMVTVCGYKSVIKFFPHQVSDLELAVSLLEKCDDTNAISSLRQESTGEMETKCVTLLWLSILVLVPFDIASVDSSIANNLADLEPPPLVLRMLGYCKHYLSNAGPMRPIAGLLLSRLLTRPDMPKALSRFIEWAHSVLSLVTDDFMDHFQLLGALEALTAIFKVGSRRVLIDSVPIIWNDTSMLMKSSNASRSPLLRKYLVKLTQRIGLACLPPRSSSSRYVSKTTSLGRNISSGSGVEINKNANSEPYQSSSCQKEEDMEVPEILEDVIELLLSGLKDKDTVVRWSAAKGIGRITSHLTSSLSDEVLSSVLELFSLGEGDGSWHGGCLALAELARRGLLLPITLPKVVPVVIKALHYDIRRGPHSVGSHVRDAAAYVCWAFGRAYYHTDMKSVLEELAPHLLTVACYDREVNCRRAAAAAFQENVGRQGNYPHGINIVNAADYFSLSSRVNSYLHVSECIAQYEGYLQPFVDELLFKKICHWDKSLRELAAEALSVLVKYDPEYFVNIVLDKLIPCTLSSDLCTRHGATLAAGELVMALHQFGYVLPTDKQKYVAGVVPAIEKARLYRGKGGETMRAAVSRFIECISIAHLNLPEKTKRSLLDVANENLKHPNPQIQNAAVKALKHFVLAYLALGEKEDSCDITTKYLELLSDQNVAARRGSALALGVLPYKLLVKRWKLVLLELCRSCKIEDNPDDRDAEARVNAVKGLISVCETLTKEIETDALYKDDTVSLFLVIKNEVMGTLHKALDDYSVDNRGDVGSWVREVAMYGLERCASLLCMRDNIISAGKYETATERDMRNGSMVESSQMRMLFDEKLAGALVGGILKQAVEKMDKLREGAAKVLQRILYSKRIHIPSIPFREKLEKLVPDSEDIKWGDPAFSYPRFVQLLQFSCYSRSLLSGLVISVGGLQDSLRKASVSALEDYLQATEEKSSKECVLCSDILWILHEYRRSDRVIIPTLKTIEILFGKRMLSMEVHGPSFCSGVIDSLAIELKGSKDFSKLYAGIAILGYIASLSDPISTSAFSQLLSFLGHRYPKIRKASAEQMYLVLLQNVDLIAGDQQEKALKIISETCWEGDREMARHMRLQLCQMSVVETALLPKTNDATPSKSERWLTTTDENASYSSLVDSSGF